MPTTEKVTQHTPGPWSLEDDDIYSVYPSSELLASVYPMKQDKLFESWKANARLIAAAPELLAYAEAEEQLTQHMIDCNECDGRNGEDGECPEYRRLCKQLNPYELRRSAIRKAKEE